MRAYAYTPDVEAEVEDLLTGALGPAVGVLRAATLADDYLGKDVYYLTTTSVAIAVRVRYDRPDFAPDDDVTFRTTEPAKIRAGTYAPLAAFGWLKGNRVIAGKLIDVARLDARLDPPLSAREGTSNGDGTGFITVSIDELFETGALLRIGDRHGWANATHNASERLRRLLDLA